MVSVLTSRAVDREFDAGQVKHLYLPIHRIACNN